jgi:thioredoxin 1
MKKYFGFIVMLMLVLVNPGCRASSKDQSTTEDNINSDSKITYAENMSKFNEIISGSEPVLVDFYADWCAPCRMMAPILEKVAANMKGEVRVVKVDVDKNQDAAVKYGVRSIPTLMLFQNGEIKWQGVGVMQADQIEQIVKTKRN